MFRRGQDVSDETEVAIDREVKAILMGAQKRAREILSDKREDLDVLAVLLLEKESIGKVQRLREQIEHTKLEVERAERAYDLHFTQTLHIEK